MKEARRLLVTASVVPSSQILVTLMMQALSSSETSVLTSATRRYIPEDTTFFIVIAVKTSNLTFSFNPTYSLTCLRVPPGVRVRQVEDYCSGGPEISQALLCSTPIENCYPYVLLFESTDSQLACINKFNWLDVQDGKVRGK
jgi:hypothetical protein